MGERATNKALIIVAILTLLGSILGGAIAAGVSYGGISARVNTLEKSDPVTRDEWTQFRDDVKDQLNRIENKLDKGK